MIFGLKFSRQIGLGAGNVTVYIDTARHHHHAVSVYLRRIRWYAFDYFSILDTNIPNLAVNVVGGIMDFSVHNTKC